MQHKIHTSPGARRLWPGESAGRGGASRLLGSSDARINPRMLHSLVKKKRKITKENIDPVSDELQTEAVNPCACACVRAHRHQQPSYGSTLLHSRLADYRPRKVFKIQTTNCFPAPWFMLTSPEFFCSVIHTLQSFPPLSQLSFFIPPLLQVCLRQPTVLHAGPPLWSLQLSVIQQE